MISTQFSKTNISYNYDTFTNYYNRMKKIVLSMFVYDNLPSSMDARFLERTLFEDGQASVLKDTTKNLIINTRCSDNGNINIYELPTNLNCFSVDFRTDRLVYNGIMNEKLNQDTQAVHILNDEEKCPSWLYVFDFAERLADAQKTCDINIRAQRTPILILGTKKQKETLENMYAQYDGFKPVIMGDADYLSQDSIKSVNTGAPFVADKVQSYKKEIWNEFLTTFGINNIDVEKKERLISGESNANNELINYNLKSFLDTRKKAVEQINELFGLDIKVRINSDLYNIIKKEESIIADYNNDGIPDIIEEGEVYE